MDDHDIRTIAQVYEHLRRGVQHLAKTVSEQEQAEPEFVDFGYELMERITWPLEALERLGAINIIESETRDQLMRLAETLVNLATNEITRTPAAVRSRVEWEDARIEARRIIKEELLPVLDETDIMIKLGTID